MLETHTSLTTALDYYARFGAMTDPHEYVHLLDDLPTEIPALCTIVQGLLIHPAEAYLYHERISHARKQELHLRSVRRMLTRLLEIDDAPLTIARPPHLRLVGNCRDFATLFCTFLRSQAIPVRVRCGFGVYFDNNDHWVCEYWNAHEERWVLVDPQLSEVECKAYAITFNPCDMPRDRFVIAGEAWHQCSLDGVDSRRYGFRRWRGKNFIAGSILRDLAALNKVEVLAWDLGDVSEKSVEDLSTVELAHLNQIADLTVAAITDNTVFPQLRRLYEGDRRLHEKAEALIDSDGSDMESRSIQQVSVSPNLYTPISETMQSHKRPRPTAREAVTNLEPDKLIVRGAQQHNLKHVDVSIPRYKFVVLTGVSGSGKSSLAFDTIYAEGQRRYVESLSPFVRHYLEKVEKPKVDFIGGLSPAIAIEQKTISKNPRSTVGTVTEVINYLRLLYSRVGVAHCISCGTVIRPQSPSEMARQLVGLPVGTRLHLLAPLVRERKGTHTELLAQALHDGYTTARIDGVLTRLTSTLTLAETRKHTIELLVDSVQVAEIASDSTWIDPVTVSIRTALKLGSGLLIVATDTGYDITLSEQKVCSRCGSVFPELTSQHFSPNSPLGMCASCNGLGTKLEIDPSCIVEDPTVSILDGALRFYGDIRKKKSASNWPLGQLQGIADHYGVDLELAWQDLPQTFRDVILYGSGEEKVHITHSSERNEESWSGESTRVIKGLVYTINRLFRQTKSDYMRRSYMQYMSQQPCPACNGTRLSPEVRAVTLNGKSISDIGSMTLADLLIWVDDLYDSLDDEAFAIASEILKETQARLQFMLNVGLHYLTLDRTAPSLSGGEGQRIRLASQLSCGLVGVLYVLDEPSIGLHARDQRTLLDTLLQLRDIGNTVLVVEHDAETMRAADWLIDMGPGAGVLGGKVVAAGTPEQVMTTPNSLTGRYLGGQLEVTSPHHKQRRQPTKGWLSLVGASLHNLKHVKARFPLGLLTCVTGVSGSGKSSLINGTLYPALMNAISQTTVDAPIGPYERLEGLEHLNKVINITQDAIGRTPRSNPATYVGFFDEIRAILANTDEARKHGYKADRFSFNVVGGRCETCKGHGQRVIEMHFLSDVWVTCKECGGTRFNRETLAIRYKGKNIAEILDLDVQEALEFFADFPKLARILQTLHDVGLDYVKLGQSATTFSGGEAQRIKLAKELSRIATGKTLYILDEPTTGLHFADIQRLLDVLHRLVDAGNTVLVIEHNLDVIKTADWLIDMGPEGGEDGGYILAEGTPEDVVQVEASYTGRFLRKHT